MRPYFEIAEAVNSASKAYYDAFNERDMGRFLELSKTAAQSAYMDDLVLTTFLAEYVCSEDDPDYEWLMMLVDSIFADSISKPSTSFNMISFYASFGSEFLTRKTLHENDLDLDESTIDVLFRSTMERCDILSVRIGRPKKEVVLRCLQRLIDYGYNYRFAISGEGDDVGLCQYLFFNHCSMTAAEFNNYCDERIKSIKTTLSQAIIADLAGMVLKFIT